MNIKQKLFCEYYAGQCAGNGEKAAAMAGYSQHSARFTAHKLLQKPEVKQYLHELSDKVTAENIATIEDIQAFWSDIMTNEEEPTKNRLRASELLAKCKGMFNADTW